MYYVPKFVKQVSDLDYGSIVTHEQYNEKLNLNMEQGDYNTEVLRILFTEREIDKAYRVPYLEKYTDDAVSTIKNEIKEHIDQIDTNTRNINDNKNLILGNASDIDGILDGRLIVALSKYANKVDGIDQADAHTYYGKDYDGKIGFHMVPDGIFAEDISSETAEINGIYYVPRADSVEESMLTDDVRAKLNRAAITSYPELSNKPTINGIILEGESSLATLGIQPAGSYITEIPEEYITYDKLNLSLSEYMTEDDLISTFATISSLTDLSDVVTSNARDVANTYARVFIGSIPEGYTPKNGDLLIDLA